MRTEDLSKGDGTLGEALPKAPRRLRVLVVDDNLDQVRTLAFLVKDAGHHVDYAINGIVALELAQRAKPDAILLDIFLPDTSGFELLRQIRRDPELRKTHVIAITGLSLERDDAVLNGFNELLRKPIRFADVEAALAKIE
jgi:CheY-like chemotaxis protein